MIITQLGIVYEVPRYLPDPVLYQTESARFSSPLARVDCTLKPSYTGTETRYTRSLGPIAPIRAI